MVSIRRHNRLASVVVMAGLGLLLAACGQGNAQREAPTERLGLMSTLPILWQGNDAFADLTQGKDAPRHWAVGALEQSYILQPMDALTSEALAQIDRLLLAQPRILAPIENVALDEWVRAGGEVLVMADPQLVGEYDFALGDPRRPLDSAMLSPILARWGLELTVDPAAAIRTIPLGEAEMAVAAPGAFRVIAGGAASRCTLRHDGLIAQCSVGKGRVVLLADATLVEDPEGGEGSAEALSQLLGMTRETTRQSPAN